jgi:hypothetical protein
MISSPFKLPNIVDPTISPVLIGWPLKSGQHAALKSGAKVGFSSATKNILLGLRDKTFQQNPALLQHLSHNHSNLFSHER